MIYFYDENGVYTDYKSVKSLNEFLITHDKEGNILETPVFPIGITNVKPSEPIYMNVSPKFVDGKWVADEIEVEKHLKTIIVNKAKEIMSLEQMDELLTYLAGGKA